MEILKAYQIVLDAAVELREEGIDIKVIPSESRHPEEEDGLPRPKWVRIEFFVKTAAQAQAVHKRADELSWRRIFFDTSGHQGQRQWDLDWSFEVGDVPDGEWEAAGDEVEDMIDNMEKPEGDSPKR